MSGQDKYEEVSIAEKGDNLGWKTKEAMHIVLKQKVCDCYWFGGAEFSSMTIVWVLRLQEAMLCRTARVFDGQIYLW